MADEAKLHRPVHSVLEASVMRGAVGRCCREENWAFSVDQAAAASAVLEHLFNLLSIILRCNGFTRIQKPE